MFTFLQMLSSNILTQPAYFIGIMVFIGLLAMKKPFHEALAGFIKTAVGFFILNIGSGGLTSTFKPIIDALGTKFQMEAAVVDTYFLMGQMYGDTGLFSIEGAVVWTMFAFAISIAVNFILVILNKWTRCRTLYVTGHTLQGYTTLIMWLVYLVCPAARNMGFTILFGALCGVWAAVGSNITVEATQNLTGGAGFAIGHQEMLGIWFTDKIAGLFGKPEDSVENIQLPGFLSIFKDNVVSTAILMTIFFGGLMLVIGEPAMREIDSTFTSTTLFIVYIITKCIYFSVYMYILLAGVRMFVAELMKAFEGISQKLIKGSMPAVDCAVAFNYAHPNVPLIGFIFGFFGQLIAIAGLLIFKSPLFLVPGFVPLFFDNATIAIYANKRGGKNAAILCSMLNGLFQVLISFVMIMFVKGVGGYSLSAWPAFFDNNTFFAGLMVLINFVGPYGGAIIAIIALLVLNQLYYRKHKAVYYNHIKEN